MSPSKPHPPRPQFCCAAKAAPAKAFWRGQFMLAARESLVRLLRLPAQAYQLNCWKVNCSDTRKARLPEQFEILKAKSLLPRAAPCSWTKLATCRSHFSPNCCASCKKKVTNGSAKHKREPATCESSPPPIVLWKPKSPPAAFERISSIA